MKNSISTAALCGAMLVPSMVSAQALQADHFSRAELLEKAKALDQTAAKSGGSASVTLAKYPNHFTMLTLRHTSGGAELHRKFADFFYVVRGEAALTTGGTLIDAKEPKPGELSGSGISGGTQVALREGDVVHIPAGVPHQLAVPQGGEFLYYVIKVQEQ